MGSTADALRGLSDHELGVPPERTKQVIARLREAREARAPVSIDLDFQESDGTIHTLEETGHRHR